MLFCDLYLAAESGSANNHIPSFSPFVGNGLQRTSEEVGMIIAVISRSELGSTTPHIYCELLRSMFDFVPTTTSHAS